MIRKQNSAKCIRGENNYGRLSSSVIARTTACASNAKSSTDDDCENSGRFSLVYFLIMPSVHPGREEKKKGGALIALPSDVADTHRPYNGLPVLVKFVWRENFHESTLRCSSHEHRIHEVAAIHAQHDLSTSTSFSLCVRERSGPTKS
jgi:hypothetical protein